MTLSPQVLQYMANLWIYTFTISVHTWKTVILNVVIIATRRIVDTWITISHLACYGDGDDKYSFS